MTPRQLRTAFFAALADSLDCPSASVVRCDGVIAWPSRVGGREGAYIDGPALHEGCYHRLHVTSQYGDYRGSGARRLLPWVRLNCADFPISGYLARRWGVALGYSPRGWVHRFAPSNLRLELTVHPGELLAFAPWLAAWIRAHERNDAGLLPPPPAPLLRPAGRDPFHASDLWTRRAESLHKKLCSAVRE